MVEDFNAQIDTSRESLPQARMSFGELTMAGQVYRKVASLGEGAYGGVLLDANSEGERVVIKIVNLDVDQQGKTAFVKEIDILRGLAQYQEENGLAGEDNCHTPRVLAINERRDGMGRPGFFVMEEAKGKTLADYISTGQHGPEYRLNSMAAAMVGEQACYVFQALHEGLGMSDLDFQPRNIFWDETTRRATVIDFNLLAPHVKPSGEIVPVDVASDLYNLCSALYRSVTGRTVDDLDTKGIGQCLTDDKMEEKMKSIFRKGLSPDKDIRYKTARELRSDFLEAIV